MNRKTAKEDGGHRNISDDTKKESGQKVGYVATGSAYCHCLGSQEDGYWKVQLESLTCTLCREREHEEYDFCAELRKERQSGQAYEHQVNILLEEEQHIDTTYSEM